MEHSEDCLCQCYEIVTVKQKIRNEHQQQQLQNKNTMCINKNIKDTHIGEREKNCQSFCHVKFQFCGAIGILKGLARHRIYTSTLFSS